MRKMSYKQKMQGLLQLFRTSHKAIIIVMLATVMFPTAIAITNDGVHSSLTFDTDDITGSTFVDVVGNKFNGTNNGGTSGVTGIINQSVEIESSETADRVNLLNTYNLFDSTKNFTINVWVNREGNGDGDPTILDFRGEEQFIPFSEDSSGSRPGCSAGTAYRVTVFTGGGTAQNFCPASEIVLANSQWHMLTLTYDAGTDNLTIYQNGTYKGSATTTWTTGATGGHNNVLGNDGDYNQDWDGKLDEFIVFNRTISDSDVTDLYNNGIGLQYPFTTSETVSLTTPSFTQTNYTPTETINASTTISNSNSSIYNVTAYWSVIRPNNTQEISDDFESYTADQKVPFTNWTNGTSYPPAFVRSVGSSQRLVGGLAGENGQVGDHAVYSILNRTTYAYNIDNLTRVEALVRIRQRDATGVQHARFGIMDLAGQCLATIGIEGGDTQGSCSGGPPCLQVTKHDVPGTCAGFTGQTGMTFAANTEYYANYIFNPVLKEITVKWGTTAETLDTAETLSYGSIPNSSFSDVYFGFDLFGNITVDYVELNITGQPELMCVKTETKQGSNGDVLSFMLTPAEGNYQDGDNVTVMMNATKNNDTIIFSSNVENSVPIIFVEEGTLSAIQFNRTVYNSTQEIQANTTYTGNFNATITATWFKNAVQVFQEIFNAVTNNSVVTAILSNANYTSLDKINITFSGSNLNTVMDNTTINNTKPVLNSLTLDKTFYSPGEIAVATINFTEPDKRTNTTASVYWFVNGVLNETSADFTLETTASGTTSKFNRTFNTTGLTTGDNVSARVNITDNPGGSIVQGNASASISELQIIPGGCFPNPANLSQQVRCNATVTGTPPYTVRANLTLPNGTVVDQVLSNESTLNFFNASTTGSYGEYFVSWFVNDTGTASGSDGFNITNPNPPNITDFTPSTLNFTLVRNNNQTFTVTVTDDQALTEQFFVNGALNGSGTTLLFNTPISGLYEVMFVANDTDNNVSVQWNVTVINGTPSVTVSLEAVTDIQNANASIGYTNTDFSDGNVFYEWYVNGESVSSNTQNSVSHDSSFEVTLDNDNFVANDNITLCANTTVGGQFSGTVCDSTIVSEGVNTIPTLLAAIPDTGMPVCTGTTITWTANFTDPDDGQEFRLGMVFREKVIQTAQEDIAPSFDQRLAHSFCQAVFDILLNPIGARIFNCRLPSQATSEYPEEVQVVYGKFHPTDPELEFKAPSVPVESVLSFFVQDNAMASTNFNASIQYQFIAQEQPRCNVKGMEGGIDNFLPYILSSAQGKTKTSNADIAQTVKTVAATQGYGGGAAAIIVGLLLAGFVAGLLVWLRVPAPGVVLSVPAILLLMYALGFFPAWLLGSVFAITFVVLAVFGVKSIITSQIVEDSGGDDE